MATDTAAESAITNGFGYFRINLSKDRQDLVFERVGNPFRVYGDPDSEAADSSDWDCAFVVTMLSKEKFEDKYNDAEAVDWEASGYTGLPQPWFEGDQVMIAEYWHREDVEVTEYKLSDGRTVSQDYIDEPSNQLQMLMTGIQAEPVKATRPKVTQYIMTGAEVLETNDWPGSFIPIIPVYGDEINEEGKRHFRSLINPVKDAQRQYNYWETMATELIALAPKAPFIGEEGAFDIDPRWATSNSETHPYLQYKKGSQMPQRQPFAGVPGGVLAEAARSNEDMKRILGIFGPGLEAPSPQSSGVARRVAAAAGDVSTFHFVDNLSRAIRHAGRILIDLIPKVYNKQRVIRTLGEDMKPKTVKIGPQTAQPQQAPQMPPQAPQMGMQGINGIPGEMPEQETSAIDRIYDLSIGKYDLIVKSGPSFSSMREQARTELIDVIRSFPASATILGPMYLRNSDWPGAEEAADKLEAMMQSQGQQQATPPDPAAMAAAQINMAKMQADSQAKQADNAIKAEKVKVEAFEAETDRMRAMADIAMPRTPANNPNGLA